MKKSTIFMLCLVGVIPMLNGQRLELGKDINITQAIRENLYTTGNNITINAPIYGDLVTAGGIITINDTIQKDILLAGGTIIFNGYAGDDVRCAGGELHVKKDIKGDLVIAGGKVIIDKNVTIGGNLLVSGGEIYLDGTVKGNIRGAFGKLYMNGIAEQNIYCKGGKLEMNGTVKGQSSISAPEIVIGNNAAFLGDVHYWNKQGYLKFGESAKSGIAIYDGNLRIETGGWYYIAFALIGYLGAAILMIFLTQYLFSKTMKRASDTVSTETLKSLGYGLLYFVGVPVAIIVACITVIGIPIGLILLFGYIITMALATVITSVVAANWLNTKYNYNWRTGKMVLTATGIFIVLKLLSFIFMAGWLVSVASLIALGAILLNINWRRKEAI